MARVRAQVLSAAHLLTPWLCFGVLHSAQFAIVENTAGNMGVGWLVPPGLVATQQSSGPSPLLFLSMDVMRGYHLRRNSEMF